MSAPHSLAGGQRHASKAAGAAVPSEEAVVEWLSALLDAQLGALVRRSEAAPLLAQLQVPDARTHRTLHISVKL